MSILSRLHWPHISFRSEPKRLTDISLGRTALAISVLAQSTFNPFAKRLGMVLSPLSLMFVSELLTTVFTLLTYGMFPTIHSLVNIPKKKIVPLLLVGFIMGVAAPGLWFWGLDNTTSINAVLFGRTNILFMTFFGILFLSEKATLRHYLAIALCIIGVVIMAMQGFHASINLAFGDLLMIGAALSAAVGDLLIRKYLPDVEPHLPLFMRCLMVIATFSILSPYLIETLAEEMILFPLALIPTLLAFAFISRFVNTIMYYTAVDHLPLVTVSIGSSLQLATSVIFSAYLLGEVIELYHIVGGIFLITSNILLALRHAEPDAPDQPIVHASVGGSHHV